MPFSLYENIYFNNSNRIPNIIVQFDKMIENTIASETDFLKYINVEFTREEIINLRNCAIIKYLLIWIENSRNTSQTTYSFVKQKYSLSSEQKRKKKGEYILEVDESYRKQIERAIEKLKNNYFVQEKQAKLENTKHKKSDRINFIDLCFAESYANYELSLYKLLYINKEPLMTRHNTNDEKGIKVGYKDFEKFLKGIINEKSDRLFTIKSLLFYKLETTYRFVFGAKLGQYMYERKIDINSKIPNSLNVFYQRICCIDLKNGIEISPFVMNYDSIISSAFKGNINDYYETKILEARKIIGKTLTGYCKYFEAYRYCEWAEEDFVNAANFLKKDFNIIESVSQLDLNDYTDSKSPSIFDYIKDVFLNLGLYDNDLLFWCREKSKNLKK